MAEAITITRKVLFGETFTVGELLVALKDKKLSKSTRIQISTNDNYGMLTAVYECRHCTRIHILGTRSFTERKKLQKFLYENAKIVYGGGAGQDDESELEKKDLIAILKKIEDKETKLLMETMKDVQEYKDYTIAGVYKCADADCPIIHLSAAYEKEAPNLN